MISHRLKRINIKYAPQRLQFAPEWIVLGVNNLCNLHCKMCDVGTQYENSNFYYNLMGSRPLNMPLDLLQRIIDQTAAYFPKAKLGYAFTEPLIYPHLVESLAYADEQHLYTTITTNALTLEKKADDLANAGLNELFISLDGPEEIHNYIRGNRRSFQKAIAGMEKVFSLSGKQPAVSIFCTITEWNVGHLAEFVDFFQEYPIKQIGFMHTNFTPDDVVNFHNSKYGEYYPATLSNMEEISLEEMNLENLHTEIRQIKSKTYPFPVSFSPDLESIDDLSVFYHQPERIIGNICNDAFRTIMVKSDGSVIPAHGRCYNLTIGDIHKESLKDIWNSSVIAKFRKTLMDAGGLLPACSRCCSAF